MSAQSKSLSARLAHSLAAALIIWAGLAAVWMLLVDNESLPELLVGAGVVCLATAGVELVRAQRIAHLRVHAAWVARLWRPLARVPLDVGIVMVELIRQLGERRRERGQLRALRFRAVGHDAESSGRRALAELGGSLAPNTIVLGVDRSRRVILVHQLKPTGEGERALDPLELG